MIYHDVVLMHHVVVLLFLDVVSLFHVEMSGLHLYVLCFMSRD